MDDSNDKIAAIVDQVETIKEVVTSAATVPPPPTNTQPAQPQRPLFSDIAKSTIVLQSINRNIPVGQVQKDLNASDVALPVATVERVRPTRNMVEILCKGTAAMEQAKWDLQQNQIINKSYNCVQKTAPQTQTNCTGCSISPRKIMHTECTQPNIPPLTL